jgi:hypothetical protein
MFATEPCSITSTGCCIDWVRALACSCLPLRCILQRHLCSIRAAHSARQFLLACTQETALVSTTSTPHAISSIVLVATDPRPLEWIYVSTVSDSRCIRCPLFRESDFICLCHPVEDRSNATVRQATCLWTTVGDPRDRNAHESFCHEPHVAG